MLARSYNGMQISLKHSAEDGNEPSSTDDLIDAMRQVRAGEVNAVEGDGFTIERPEEVKVSWAPKTKSEWMMVVVAVGAMGTFGVAMFNNLAEGQDVCTNMRENNPEKFAQAVDGLNALIAADPNLQITEFDYSDEGKTCRFPLANLEL